MTEKRTAVVTGGSRGIGRAIALKLAGLGYEVCIVYAGNEDAAKETLRLAGEAGNDRMICVKADISTEEGARLAMETAAAQLGQIDVLVNNAGITRDGLLIAMKEEDFDRVIEVNLKGTFLCCKAVCRGMIRRRSGRIINLSSIVGVCGNAGQVNYAASKAGVIGLTKSLAKELTGRGITVNAVAPGVIETDMTAVLTEEQKKKAQTVTESYLDLCVSDKKEAEELGVYVGASIVPESPCTRMPQNPDYVVTRAADCRVLLAIIIETMIDLKPEDIKGEVAAVFTILEESTVKAIATPADYYQPDYGMFLDTIPCGDVPDVDINELPVGLGKGPVIIQSQTLAAAYLHNTSHPKLMEAVETIAQSECIQVQPVAFNGAGYSTDAVGAMLSGTGMATVTLACPRRYSHSPVEIFNLNDVVMTQRIVSTFAKLDVDLKMF